MGRKRTRIFVLNSPHALRVDPYLAEEIGLNESIVLLQLEFLISIAPEKNFRDGRYWTYQSVRDLRQSYFPWWSPNTINLTIQRLEEKRLIFTANYNKRNSDKTRWFALNYDALGQLSSISLNQHQAPPPPPPDDEPDPPQTLSSEALEPVQKSDPPTGGVVLNQDRLSYSRTGLSYSRTTLPETTPETTNNNNNTPVSVEGGGANDDKGLPVVVATKILKKLGIYKSMHGELLKLPHVTEDYLKSWLNYHQSQSRPPGGGFYVEQIRAGELAPLPNGKKPFRVRDYIKEHQHV